MSTSAASVLAWTGATACVLAGASLWATGTLAQCRAATAADLGALAGADALAVGGDPCSTAAQTVHRNEAVLASCTVDGQDVLVTVTVAADPLPPMAARARAGPAPQLTSGVE